MDAPALNWVLAMYLVVALTSAFVGSLAAFTEEGRTARFAARAALLAPVWPLALVFLVLIGLALFVRHLWRTAFGEVE